MLLIPSAGGTGLIPGQGTKFPYATWYGLKNKSIDLNLNFSVKKI